METQLLIKNTLTNNGTFKFMSTRGSEDKPTTAANKLSTCGEENQNTTIP